MGSKASTLVQEEDETELRSLDMSDSVAKELKARYETYGLEGCREYYRRAKDEWREFPLNIAVIGNSGVGKSTLINTLRGLTAEDEGAAEVGVVETTKRDQMRSYDHPSNKELKLWDLPGLGTPSYPKSTYLAQIEVDKFDFFLLVSSSRFTENEIWLAEEFGKRKKAYFYIRSKVDLDVRNHRESKPRTHHLTDPVQKIRDDIAAKIKDCSNDPSKVFLVSGMRRDQFDFNRMEMALIEAFPEIKRQALVFSLGAFSSDMIKAKVKQLSLRAWGMSVISAGGGAIPVPGVSAAIDIVIIVEESIFYFHTLGLDAKSLAAMGKLMNVALPVLEKVVLRSIPYGTLTKETALALLKLLGPRLGVEMAGEEFARFIPIVGPIVGAAMSLITTKLTLKFLLKKMSTVAQEVLDAAVAEATKKPDDE